MQTMMKYNAVDKKAEIFSANSGNCILELDGVDFGTAYRIEAAIRIAEKDAVERTKIKMATEYQDFIDRICG